MYNNNILFIGKGDNTFFYENEDFSIELMGSHIQSKNNNTYSQNISHFHSYNELQIILDGSSNYEMETKDSFEVKKGNFVIFPPRIKHKITRETSFISKFVIAFKISYKNGKNSRFYSLLEEKLQNCDVFPCNEYINSIFQIIFQLSQKKNFNYKTTCFFLEFSMIMEIFNIIVGKEITNFKKEYDDIRINKAIEYIKNNMNATLRVSDIAKHLNLSTRQFTKIFTEQTGTPPGKYINNRKILYSADLLTNYDLSVNDIANMLGFPDSSTFIKAFKKSKGITPSKYRKMNK